jgi:hypothetical protein
MSNIEALWNVLITTLEIEHLHDIITWDFHGK